VASDQLSEHVAKQIRREHPQAAQRVAALREQALRLRSLSEHAERELEEAMRTLRSIEELLGIAPQLSLDAFGGELRGRRLREIAIEILRKRRNPSAIVHYREWYELLAAAGIRVAGKDPLATFLTQVSQSPEVESVRPRSGLYRLKAA
jgi:hypothetical protein